MTRKVTITAGVEQQVYDQLKALSERTRVPLSVWVRDAVTELLARHTTKVEGGGATMPTSRPRPQLKPLATARERARLRWRVYDVG